MRKIVLYLLDCALSNFRSRAALPKLISAKGVRWGELALVSMIALIPVLIAAFLLQRNIIRGLTMGAVKG